MTSTHQSDKVFLFWPMGSARQEQYAFLSSQLLSAGWRVDFLETSSSLDSFNVQNVNSVCLAIFSSELNQFRPSQAELAQVLKFLENDKVCLFAAQSHQENKTALLNKIVSKFGIEFNQQEFVIRPNPYKLYHPKEAFLQDFIANRGLEDALKSVCKRNAFARSLDDDEDKLKLAETFQFLEENSPSRTSARASHRSLLYPNGCTLKVDAGKDSTILMSSSKWTLPSRQAICALNREAAKSARCIALGSAELLSDRYLNLEDNLKIVMALLEFATSVECSINSSDAKTIEIPPNNMTADMETLANIPICCLKQAEPLPENVATLIDSRLFTLNTLELLPQISRAYRDLNVKHEKLKLMFERESFKFTRVRRFEPAVHGFLLRKIKLEPN